MDRSSQREYQGEMHYYNQKAKPPLPFWRRYLWQMISFGLVVLLALTILIAVGMGKSSPSAPPILTSGTWQGQFAYAPSEPYNGSFQATLHIPSHQGTSFTGTLFEPLYGDTTVSVSGIEGGSSPFDQSKLQYVTQLYGTGTETFIEFTDPTYINGNQIQLNCTYIAVVFADNSLHGVWFYPGRVQPDGTFLLSR